MMRFRSISLTPWQRDFALIVIPVVAVLGASMTPRLLNDADTYWHLATGAWILQHGAPPTTDPFSYTFQGRPWVAHEWLSEVIYAVAYGLGGLPAVLLAAMAAVAGCCAIIAARVTRQLGPLGTFLTILGFVGMLLPSLLARPHVLVLPIIAAWTVEMLNARRRNRAPSLWLLPLMTLWANMHGSYVFGFFLLAPFALEALVAAEAGQRLRVLLGWGAFGLATVAAAAITPHGPAGLIFPFQLMSLKTIGMITEWNPVDFAKIGPFEVVLLTTLFLCLWRGVRVPLIRLALLIFLLHMALTHARHGMVLGVVGALVLAEPFRRAFPQASEEVTAPVSRREAYALTAAAAVLCVVVTAIRLATPLSPVDTRNTPVKALAHVPAALRSRPVLNEYGVGGLLIFEGIKPFIDGRADMYGDDHMTRYRNIVRGDRAAFDAAVRQYDIAWIILDPNNALSKMLPTMPGWRRLYADNYAVVYERTGPLPPPPAAAKPPS
jgi:hypothetical protein